MPNVAMTGFGKYERLRRFTWNPFQGFFIGRSSTQGVREKQGFPALGYAKTPRWGFCLL